MKYIPHTQADIDQMLQVVGVDTLDDLYGEVPEQLKLKRELDLPSAMSALVASQVPPQAIIRSKAR